jgi:hypothetical protein
MSVISFNIPTVVVLWRLVDLQIFDTRLLCQPRTYTEHGQGMTKTRFMPRYIASS